MSGHSKWANIKNKKAKTDSQKAVVFQKYSRELIVATRLGGADPNGNFRFLNLSFVTICSSPEILKFKNTL